MNENRADSDRKLDAFVTTRNSSGFPVERIAEVGVWNPALVAAFDGLWKEGYKSDQSRKKQFSIFNF